MDSRREKDALFEAIALMGKAFSSPRRLELLDLLAQAPRTVDAVARASGQSTANTSQHLQALHAAGMVTRAREGTSVRYALASDQALALWLALRDASVSQLAEVERAARDYLGDDVDAIGRDELIARLRKGDVVLVDVRSEEHTSELQSRVDLVCRLLLEKKKKYEQVKEVKRAEWLWHRDALEHVCAGFQLL